MSQVAPPHSARASRRMRVVHDFRYDAGVVFSTHVLEPFRAFFERLRLGVECGGPVQDLVVVNVDYGGEIALSCVTDIELHGVQGWISVLEALRLLVAPYISIMLGSSQYSYLVSFIKCDSYLSRIESFMQVPSFTQRVPTRTGPC